MMKNVVAEPVKVKMEIIANDETIKTTRVFFNYAAATDECKRMALDKLKDYDANGVYLVPIFRGFELQTIAEDETIKTLFHATIVECENFIPAQ